MLPDFLLFLYSPIVLEWIVALNYIRPVILLFDSRNKQSHYFSGLSEITHRNVNHEPVILQAVDCTFSVYTARHYYRTL